MSNRLCVIWLQNIEPYSGFVNLRNHFAGVIMMFSKSDVASLATLQIDRSG